MDLSPFRRSFEKIRTRQLFYHSLKDHPMFSKTAKFGCQILQNKENIVLQSWQFFYTFVLREEN